MSWQLFYQRPFLKSLLFGSGNEIKKRIRMLIAEEDKSRPLSDIEIVDYFAKQGIKLARRTITKYWKVLVILPSNLSKA